MNTFIPMCIRVQGVIERCSDIMTSHVCGVDDMCMDASCIKIFLRCIIVCNKECLID